MKAKILLSIIIYSLLTGCASLPQSHSRIEQQIDAHTQKLTEDAKDFIATATDILSDVADRSKDPKLMQALDIIKKSQSLLNAKIDDGEQFKKMTSEQLQKAIDKIYEQDTNIKKLVEQLESKEKQLTGQMTIESVANKAVKDHEFWKSFKLYSILGTVALAIVAVFVYVPTSAIRGGLNLIGLFKKTPPDEPQSRP